MNETTKQALLSIERCLDMNKTRPSAAIAAAYQLGRLDGMLEMSKVGEDIVADIRKQGQA